MSFNIFYDKQPEKFLSKLDKHISIRITTKVEDALTDNPVPHNATTIVGEHGVYRVRIGDYRALYRVDYTNKKVIIIKLDKRPRVYG
jgi:mRNA interferase RelE/StbE